MFITHRTPFLFSTGEGDGGGPAPETAPETTTANTPDTGTGTTDQQASQVNWEERYREASAWGTKNAQRVAELERHEQLINAWNSDDPDQQRWAAEQLGIQLEEDDTEIGEGEYAPIDPKILQRLEAFEQAQAQQEQSAQEQAGYAQYRADVDPQLEQMGVPKGLQDAVAEAALNMPGVQTPQGLRPDLQGAVEQIVQFAVSASQMPQVRNKFLESYRQTKQAPHIPSSGQAGTQVPPLGNHANRVKRALEIDALNNL